MAAGQLTVNVAADTRKAQKNLRDFGKGVRDVRGPVDVTHKAVTRLATGLAGLVAARVTVGALSGIADELDRTAKVSDKLGILPERLAGLRHAAEQTGVATGKLDMSLQRMVRRVGEAAQGTGEAVKALDELGLDAQRLARLAPDRQFAAIADAMRRIESPADRVRLAFKLFDSEGVDLVNTLALGSQGLEKMQRDAQRLGLAMSRESLAGVEAYNDAMDRLSKSLGGLGREIVIDVAPLAAHTVNGLVEAIEGLRLLRGEGGPRTERQRRNAPITLGLFGEEAVRDDPLTDFFRRQFSGVGMEAGPVTDADRARFWRPVDDAARETAENTGVIADRLDELRIGAAGPPVAIPL